MNWDIEIKVHRCFCDTTPARAHLVWPRPQHDHPHLQIDANTAWQLKRAQDWQPEEKAIRYLYSVAQVWTARSV